MKAKELNRAEKKEEALRVTGTRSSIRVQLNWGAKILVTQTSKGPRQELLYMYFISYRDHILG